jgi:dienelactone hydrolase
MTDFPLLIPTTEGPVGAIVSEPEGAPRGAVVLLPGWGRPARSGINSFWTRLARDLASDGLLVLRFDWSREGETLPIGEGGSGGRWKRELDLHLLTQVLAWFRERAGDLPLQLVGVCSGARAAIEIAGREPEDIAGLLLIAPHLQPIVEVGEDAAEQDATPIAPEVIACFRRISGHCGTWILTGEHDGTEISALHRSLDPATAPEAEVVPDTSIHFLDQPEVQKLVAARLKSQLVQTVGANS